jgi:hypothetical protein
MAQCLIIKHNHKFTFHVHCKCVSDTAVIQHDLIYYLKEENIGK